MAHPDPDTGRRHDVGAALVAGALVALASTLLTVARVAATDRAVGRLSDVLAALLVDWCISAVLFAAFLLAVLLVVRKPTRRSVAGGAVLLYGIGLLLAVGSATLSGFTTTAGLTALAAPLDRVAVFLGVATAVWLAYHGGYDWLVAPNGDEPIPDAPTATRSPGVTDDAVSPGLPLRRGVAVAAVAALVAVGGLVVAGGLADLLTALARWRTADLVGITVSFWVRDVGISLGRTPVQWLFEASFLLGVLFVTGPRVRPWDVATGVIAVFAVQSTVELLPMLLPPFNPVSLLSSLGPIVTPLSDVLLVGGIATAVWLRRRDDWL